jgi:hypothetical protein
MTKKYDAENLDFGFGGIADLLSGPRGGGTLGPFLFGEPVPVAKRTAGLPLIDLGALRFADCTRAPGVQPRRAIFDVSTVPYTVNDLALIAEIPAEDLAGADEPWKLKRAAAIYLLDTLEAVSEQLAVSVVGSASNVSTVFTCKSSWLAGGNPIVAINAGLDQVQASAGYRPTRLALGREAAGAIWANGSVLTATNGAPTLEKLSEIFRVSTTAIGESFVNSASCGLGYTPRFFWRDMVVAVVAPDRDDALFSARWACRPTWQSAARWIPEAFGYDEKNKSFSVGVSGSFDYTVVDPRLAVVITGTGSSQSGGI